MSTASHDDIVRVVQCHKDGLKTQRNSECYGSKASKGLQSSQEITGSWWFWRPHKVSAGLGDLVFLPPNVTVNKEAYYTLLNLHLESSFEKNQDGAPAHTTKLLKEWFTDCGIDYIKDWPGNSPDLSPIENLWAIMKAHLRNRDTSTIDKLRVTLQEEWDSLDRQILQKLADSVLRRLKEVLSRKRKSDVTKY